MERIDDLVEIDGKMRINVKLGSGSSYGWYNQDTEAEFTCIQKDKLPHSVLRVLTENIYAINMGVNQITLNGMLDDVVKEDYSKDEYGNYKSLPMLLKDFYNGNIIEYTPTRNIKITKFGLNFLKYNILN